MICAHSNGTTFSGGTSTAPWADFLWGWTGLRYLAHDLCYIFWNMKHMAIVIVYFCINYNLISQCKNWSPTHFLLSGVLTLCNIFIVNFFQDVYWQLGDLLDIAALLNNSINFVLYCTMSRQFRDTFVETFCSCCPEQRPGWLKLQTFSVTANGTTTTTATDTSAITHKHGNGTIIKAEQV